ncbi:MAG: ABC transporter permease subunit [Chloroflexi bacterium]|nr:ABC transporter permease subunit [Chloroflexota bacterium]MBV9894137.1 ABC transporter permease subunit [Chloroflexota bacterium]
MRRSTARWTSLGVLLGLAVAWQIASMLITAESVPGEPMVPGWQVLATSTLLSLSDNWLGGLGVRGIAEGGARSYAGALLAILSNSWDTSLRLYSGLLLGACVGVLAGLGVSWSSWSRRVVALPGQIMRTFPLLALIPLFQLWFGLTFLGMMLFVAYGVGVIFFTGTVNAVRNVPPVYIQNARTLGASRLRVYRTIIVPAMFPELRSSMLLSIGVAWTAVVGAEFLGAQTGLGQIIVYAKYFGYVDRMFLVGLILLVYAALTFALVERLSRPLTVWMPNGHGEDNIVEVGADNQLRVRDAAPRRVAGVLAAGPE